MSIKTGLLFLSDFLLYHYCDFSYYRLLLHYRKLNKKLGYNKNKLRIVYPNNHEEFKNSKLRIQFYWFLCKKKSVKNSVFGCFLTQAASCKLVRKLQTFVSMNIWLDAFQNANYFMIISLWHSKKLNKSFVFKTRPEIGETSNPIQMRVGQKGSPTSSSTVNSSNVRISPQNFLSFSFNISATLT